MNNEAKIIQFREIRDFSQILSTTFAFVRQNLLPLLKHTMLILAPLIVLSNITSYYYLQDAIGFTPTSLDDVWQFYAESFWTALPGMIIGFIIIGIFSSMVYAYIRHYQETNGAAIETGQLLRSAAPYITRITIGSLASSLIVMVGLFLCIAPGVYLAVTLALVYPVILWENTGIFSAMSRSANLVKGNWWNTFGVLLVLMIVTYVLILIVSIPTTLVSVFAGISAVDGDIEQLTGIITVVTAITSFFYYPIYLIFMIGIALLYFSLVEQHDGTGLIDRVNTIGNDGPGGSGGLDAPTIG